MLSNCHYGKASTNQSGQAPWEKNCGSPNFKITEYSENNTSAYLKTDTQKWRLEHLLEACHSAPKTDFSNTLVYLCSNLKKIESLL